LGAYQNTFTGSPSKTYLGISAVYTDGTFVTVDTAYAPVAFEAQMMAGDIAFVAFDYTDYDHSAALYLKAKVYNTTTGAAVYSSSVTMSHVLHGCYFGSFVPTTGQSYVVVKTIYTDSGFTTVDTQRAVGIDVVQGSALSLTLVTNYIDEATITGADVSLTLVEGAELDGTIEGVAC
jgi:hypothetical protein